LTASDLSEWIAIFQMELTPDGQGGFIETVPAGLSPDRPAHVRRLSGQELTASDQISSRIRYDVTIRYEPAVSAAWRVMWRDQLLDVLDANNVGNGDSWLTLRCERKEAGVQ
jgi:SPP1 family predicted phage head-tail adaptor